MAKLGGSLGETIALSLRTGIASWTPIGSLDETLHRMIQEYQ
jgi:hypothetical protein